MYPTEVWYVRKRMVKFKIWTREDRKAEEEMDDCIKEDMERYGCAWGKL